MVRVMRRSRPRAWLINRELAIRRMDPNQPMLAAALRLVQVVARRLVRVAARRLVRVVARRLVRVVARRLVRVAARRLVRVAAHRLVRVAALPLVRAVARPLVREIPTQRPLTPFREHAGFRSASPADLPQVTAPSWQIHQPFLGSNGSAPADSSD